MKETERLAMERLESVLHEQYTATYDTVTLMLNAAVRIERLQSELAAEKEYNEEVKIILSENNLMIEKEEDGLFLECSDCLFPVSEGHADDCSHKPVQP